MAHFDGLSQRQIASHLAISPSSVQTHLARGTAKVRAEGLSFRRMRTAGRPSTVMVSNDAIEQVASERILGMA